MIPNNGVTLKNGIKVIRQPTRTYKLDFVKNRITQYTNQLAAMEQFVYKVLQTDRYRYVIYNWNYGFEVDDLLGKPTVYVKAELPRRVQEALLADDRVTGVDNFSFPDPSGSVNADKRTTVCIKFTVHTIFGNVDITKEVPV